MAHCKLHAVWFHEPCAFTRGRPVYFGPKCTCWRRFTAQWGECTKFRNAPLNTIIIIIIVVVVITTKKKAEVLVCCVWSPLRLKQRNTFWNKRKTSWLRQHHASHTYLPLQNPLAVISNVYCISGSWSLSVCLSLSPFSVSLPFSLLSHCQERSLSKLNTLGYLCSL